MLSLTSTPPDLPQTIARNDATPDRARGDLARIGLFTLALTCLSRLADFPARLFEESGPHVDAVATLLPACFALCAALAWYAGRRRRDALIERERRLRVERALAHHIAQNSTVLADNRRLLARLSSLQEEERVRIARELHDAFGQHLTAINANASAILGRAEHGATVPAELPRRIITSVEYLATSTRAMLTTLRPPALAAAGLVPAVCDLIAEWQRTSPRITYRLAVEGRFDEVPAEVALALYRILQEALLNCVRHAAADEVDVNLDLRGDAADGSAEIHAQVADNGIGCGRLEHARGLGVLGMRERARALHGRVDIGPRTPQGTLVRCVLPLPLRMRGAA